MTHLHFLDFFGAACGLLYLYYEFRASIWLWAVSIIMPAIDIFVYFEAGLYADVAMAAYCLLAAIYGWFVWQKRGKGGSQKEQFPISATPKRLYLPISGTFLLIWGGSYAALVHFTDSSVPIADSLGNSLTVIAMWMLSRKYIEQWWVWFVCDIIAFVLYIHKGIYFHSALYGIYTVMAVMGYLRWRKMITVRN